MGGSLLICRVAGVPVRVHWSFLLLPVLFLWQPLIGRDPDLMFFRMVAMTCLIVAVICHELAHAFTGRRLGARVHSIVLWPLGGFTQISDMPPRPSAQILLSLSGPLCNLALAVVGAGALIATGGNQYVGAFVWLNVLLGAFNLVPAYPLDGGQALRSALHAKMGYARGDLWTGRIGATAGVAMVIAGLFAGAYRFPLIIIGLIAGASSFNLLRQHRYAARSPAPRAPKTGDFRAWRLPKPELDEEIARRRKAERSDREMRRRVDRILRQIGERGMDSLTDEDRAFLKHASQYLRSRGR